ncbi:ATP-binding cassette domain-containing protein [Gordonia sp. HNM0687]|uniref:ATP-binding cassette domain-containing protein n=1 Tax=Gordonia mangrovi TaxID=2665643 RepID=A0A6L7GVT3_9ACTN|nr:ABC transporter ATP-binding protein [Gordonia mangrovi]MXP24099.1 ATP-binding cassette domain-containing protein [Gordonia mangrovi]UVF78098.1 ABC transporter ATP-binding protein [Gordonia mangrovi]
MIAAARSVTVTFGATTALDGVSVAVAPGQVVALVGGDGAGKTTLLRTFVGEIAPDSGDVEAPGKHRIGYLSAGPGSWSALTVRQNLDFVGGIYGLTGDELVGRREDVIDRAGLRIAADRLASALSGGMRRKLGAAMAMLHHPDLLVLDEPSTGVDPVSRIDLWRMISEAAAAGAGVLMSTTYLDEAERAAELVVLDRGRALATGSYDDVRAGFTGTVTSSSVPTRSDWSWRRGRQRREYWPDGDPACDADVVTPDLEDIVIALSMTRRHQEVS